MKLLGEILCLPFIYLKSLLFAAAQERKVSKLFYGNAAFKKADLILKQLYKGQSPYRISKDFLLAQAKIEVHTYGETPLTELYDFLIKAGLTEQDLFVDLGCGRGRLVFFVSSFFHCKAVGVDLIPLFCERAQKISSLSGLPCSFLCEDMEGFTLKTATVIYFYALWHEEDRLLSMIKKLSLLRKGTKVITVGFPLSDYSNSFDILFSKPVSYPWGKTELFLNVIV